MLNLDFYIFNIRCLMTMISLFYIHFIANLFFFFKFSNYLLIFYYLSTHFFEFLD